MKNLLVYLGIFLFFTSCENRSGSKNPPGVEGMWVVESVKVGENDMTPNGRWMRFNADSTQYSGNGWSTHSEGTWLFSQESGELEVSNTNGFDDPYGPFKVSFSNDTMFWKRTEEGQKIEVALCRTNEVPKTYADQLLGVWDLQEARENGQDIILRDDPSEKRYLFFMWDKRFVIQHTPEGSISGVYSVNAHQPEMTWIFDDNDKQRIPWNFEVSDNALRVTSVTPDGTHERTYKRIRQFPK